MLILSICRILLHLVHYEGHRVVHLLKVSVHQASLSYSNLNNKVHLLTLIHVGTGVLKLATQSFVQTVRLTA